MSSNISSLRQLSVEKQIDYWQRASELEEGRNEVLRMVASGETLQTILNVLCQKAQIYTPDLYCSVLRLDRENNTLHPTVSASLPQFYCDALEGVEIGLGVGSCGTAAFTKERTIVEDINTHPYWVQYKGLALEAGLQACWSEPIVGQDGKVFGTFAIYYSYPKSPSEEDLKFIELSANLAAVVFENLENKEKLLNANNKLSQTVDERTAALEQANKELAELIEQKEALHKVKIGEEKSAMANALLGGFAHEISTPIGVALTSISTAHDKVSLLKEQFEQGKLTKKGFAQLTEELYKLISFNQTALTKADSLLNQFKKVQSDQVESQSECFDIKDFMGELEVALDSLLNGHILKVEAEHIELNCDKGSLWQILYQLVENSVIHGFKDAQKGNIHISVMRIDKTLVINYQDDGIGVTKEQEVKLFDPFYTTSPKNKNMGLGMTTVCNLLANVLQGKIEKKPSPVGIRFELTIPLCV